MELLSKGNIQVSYTILVISHPNQRVCVRQHKRKKRLLSIYNRILTHREIYKINKTSNKNNNNTMEGRDILPQRELRTLAFPDSFLEIIAEHTSR